MPYYFNSRNTDSPDKMRLTLRHLTTNIRKPSQPVVIICIGSDRSTGDCLGPIVGYKLSRLNLDNDVFIYGTLESPVHAANLDSSIRHINSTHDNPFIIAIDASLGRKEHVGFLTIGEGPLKPGAGVKKKLPEVGSIHITGIVNISGVMDNVLLQTTHLSTIVNLAEIIADVLSTSNIFN